MTLPKLASMRAQNKAIFIPLFSSLFFVPINIFNIPVIPCLLAFCFLFLPDKRLAREHYVVLLILGIVSLTVFWFEPQKSTICILITLAYLLGSSIKNNAIKFNLAPTFFFHLTFVSISYFTLIFKGVDYFPEFIYGESRHLVGLNEFTPFRVSGIFQEPSTLGANMILLSLSCNISNNRSRIYEFGFLIISILSFSSPSVIALGRIVWLLLRTTRINRFLLIKIIVASCVLYLSISLLGFLSDKTRYYINSGWINTTRFEIFDVSSALWQSGDFSWLGLPIRILNEYVVLDTGFIVSMPLLLGLASLPFLALLIYHVPKNWFVLALGLTKLPITSPLLWIILTSDQPHKARLKTSFKR